MMQFYLIEFSELGVLVLDGWAWAFIECHGHESCQDIESKKMGLFRRTKRSVDQKQVEILREMSSIVGYFLAE